MANKLNEYILAPIMIILSGILIVLLNNFMPPTVEGLNYYKAAGDSIGLPIFLLALFDIHTLALIYFINGKSFKTIPELLKTPIGILAFGLTLAAWVLGSALVLIK